MRKNREVDKRRSLLRIMAWMGMATAVLTVILRVWLMPAWLDTDTGVFTAGGAVIGILVAVLAALGVMGFTQRQFRWEIGSPGAIPLAMSMLGIGVMLILSGVWDVWLWLGDRITPPPQMTVYSGLGVTVLWLQLIFGVLAGAALLRLGLVLASEGITRRGMAGWSMLAPVLWIWFRMARYEMSYASTVRLSQSFFDFAMFIVEMFFLMKLARFVAGIGKVGAGTLQFFAAATAILSLSAPLTRWAMYMLADSEAYQASAMAGVPDLALGLLGLAVAFALASGGRDVPNPPPVQPEQEEESSVSDAAAVSAEAESASEVSVTDAGSLEEDNEA